MGNEMNHSNDTLTIAEASEWVTHRYGLDVSISNISYLIQYGQIRKINANGSTRVYTADLEAYYEARQERSSAWKKQLGDDLNWDLSFDHVKEKERTKHVHRLHPYKGKFIPQLVEYFLDQHTDKDKTSVHFNPGDIVLDPFCGSGTTLVQANELAIHAVGIDVSAFNTLMSNVKIQKHDLFELQNNLTKITYALREFIAGDIWQRFDQELSDALSKYNSEYFPSPDYKFQVRQQTIDHAAYSKENEADFRLQFNELIEKYSLQLTEGSDDSFLDKWYLQPVRDEIEFVKNRIQAIENNTVREAALVILSRTVRSCRATTHADLATLKEPVAAPYYCRKHFKICKPLFSITNWWESYTQDTINRLGAFSQLRTDTHQICLTGDSRTIDVFDALDKLYPELGALARENRIKGIFSSPPYVGLINYHEQHAYAYDLFEFERRDAAEIGRLAAGKSVRAREDYVAGIAAVLTNCMRFLVDDFDIFLVANDRYNLYPQIAEQANMIIVDEFTRPVLNRTEKDKSAYAEKIFHLKRK
jgi:hypothetical protein